MKTEISHISQHLFNKNGDVSEQELRAFTEKYPYAVAGHILLIKKLVEQNSQSARDQVARTALYLHDPLWLNLLLEDGNKLPVIRSGSGLQEAIAQPDPITHQGDFEAHPLESSETALIEEQPETIVKVDEPETETYQSSEEPHQGLESGKDQFFVENVEVSHPEAGSPELSEVEVREENKIENLVETAPAGPQANETDRTNEANTVAPAPGPSAATGSLKDIHFEPYHTIDYFASQGIRLQQSELGKDRMGQQLKSFTEWLRSMKRLPQSEQDVPVDSVVQQSISRLASHSLDEREVITEAMAEVWWKQGNFEKAAEIYNKLKLLNPSKSHYFAAKIEALKNH